MRLLTKEDAKELDVDFIYKCDNRVAIISKDLFDKVKGIQRKRTKKGKNVKYHKMSKSARAVIEKKYKQCKTCRKFLVPPHYKKTDEYCKEHQIVKLLKKYI